jgi:penicillin-binding protein 1C
LLCASQAQAYVAFDAVKSGFVGSEGRLLDRHGEVLQEWRIDRKSRKLEWTPLSEVSGALKNAVLLSEDHRFYSHSGVDWLALAKAAGANILHSGARAKRGASTISMQVASAIDRRLPRVPGRRGVLDKAKQILSALDLERTWKKGEIFEAYLNLISFRGELQGISAASWGLFGKAPSGLDAYESAILAALIRSPEAGPERVELRACALGRKIGSFQDCQPLHALMVQGSLRAGAIPARNDLAPQLAQRLLNSDNRSVQTTIDKKLQAFVVDTLRKHVLDHRRENVGDAAALVLDNRTGEVLAYVGSIGDLSSARHVDGIQAFRQAGSTLKPFLYGLAIESKYLTAASLIDDAPTDIPVQGGVYRPRNYDRVFHGQVTVRTALASSLNVPAVRALALVGVPNLVRKLEAFGFRDLREAEYYGPSLALGSADISLWDLTNAYRTLAQGGLWSEARLLPGAKAVSHRALTPEAAFVIESILSDRASRSLTFGLENPLATRFWTAAKTGTSKDMRDNWCIGFSRRYTVGVWVGNFSGQPMWNVSGITGAGPSWAEIMNELHRSTPSRAPEPPAGLALTEGEWFVKGTEQRAAPVVTPRANVRITYPASGTVIAHDPNIPAELERVFFESSQADEGLLFRLNGKNLGPASAPYAWKPAEPGPYELTLVDARGRVVDSVEFKVRGQSSADPESEPQSGGP